MKLKTTTLSDDHSFKMASAESDQANPHTIITEDDHLSETRPARKKREEKTCLKQPLQIVNRCEIEIEIKHKATTIKSEHLSHYIYSAI